MGQQGILLVVLVLALDFAQPDAFHLFNF